MMLQPKEKFSYLKITNLINAQDFKFNKVGAGMLPFTDTCNQAYDVQNEQQGSNTAIYPVKVGQRTITKHLLSSPVKVTRKPF